MRLRTLRHDLEAILLAECPVSLRVALLIFALLLSHALGMAWYFVADYEREAVRAEVIVEVNDIRNQQRALWESHQAMREWRDRVDLGRRR